MYRDVHSWYCPACLHQVAPDPASSDDAVDVNPLDTLSLDELSRRLARAQEVGNTRSALMITDAMIGRLIAPASEQDDMSLLDTAHLLIVVAVAVRVLIRRDLDRLGIP